MEVRTAMGVPFRLEKPQLYDLVMGIKRQTQIMYPKDMGLICFKLGVGNGRTILEAGSGSGGFTLALSWFSGPNGHVHSFEAREEFHKLAKRNLVWAGVGDNVTFHLRDIADGFGVNDPDVLNGQKGDALFLDVRNPRGNTSTPRARLLCPARPSPFCCPPLSRWRNSSRRWKSNPLKKPKCVKFWCVRGRSCPDVCAPPTA